MRRREPVPDDSAACAPVGGHRLRRADEKQIVLVGEGGNRRVQAMFTLSFRLEAVEGPAADQDRQDAADLARGGAGGMIGLCGAAISLRGVAFFISAHLASISALREALPRDRLMSPQPRSSRCLPSSDPPTWPRLPLRRT